MVNRMQQLTQNFPDFVRLWNAQERYGLQSPGTCMSHEGADVPCLHWVMEITNFASSAADESEVLPNTLPHRPQVFLSGNLHGDEQVGPMTLIYFAEHLVRRRAAGDNAWLSRMVDTRRLIVMPMTNPLGYFQTSRWENLMDPNRDFPYNQHPGRCMATLTARAVNEVWRANLIQSAITFHGGMQAITYEWGAENHVVRKGACRPSHTSETRRTTLCVRGHAGHHIRVGRGEPHGAWRAGMRACMHRNVAAACR